MGWALPLLKRLGPVLGRQMCFRLLIIGGKLRLGPRESRTAPRIGLRLRLAATGTRVTAAINMASLNSDASPLLIDTFVHGTLASALPRLGWRRCAEKDHLAPGAPPVISRRTVEAAEAGYRGGEAEVPD